MEAEDELALYDHVDLLFSPLEQSTQSNNQLRTNRNEHTTEKTNPKKTGKKARKKLKRKSEETPTTSPKALKILPQFDYKLSATELLFFPKHYDPRPLNSTIDQDDLVRQKNYFGKINSMSPEEKRNHRANRDARYLHKNANKSKKTEHEQGSEEICYNHLTGRCNDEKECGRKHQMRKPIFFGACKFYKVGACIHGNQCSFMHEDFPCRYFYTDTEHPKSKDANNCRFKHGGPLSQQLIRYFKKQMEFWVKELTKTTPEKFDSLFMELSNKFDAKQEALELSCCINKKKEPTTIKNDDGFAFENILTKKQSKVLSDNGIATADEVRKIPIDDLLDYGLNMDQIYRINTSYYNEANQMKEDTCEVDAEILPVESTSNDIRLTLTDFSKMNENSLHGFSDIELKTAEEMLQIKQNTFNTIVYGKEREMSMNCSFESTNLNPMEKNSENEMEEDIVTETKIPDALDAKIKTGIEAESNETVVENSPLQNSISEIISEEQTAISENSDDSDDEFDLVINEEI